MITEEKSVIQQQEPHTVTIKKVDLDRGPFPKFIKQDSLRPQRQFKMARYKVVSQSGESESVNSFANSRRSL
jgi:hypothetical protein